MGSEISAIGGALATAGTAVAAGVTFGQIESVNNAVVESAKFTATNFMESNVRHVGETVGTSIAAAATLGQIESVNQCVRNSAPKCGKKLLTTASEVVDSVPAAGHLKGCIHYACGDTKGGDTAMKCASRTTGVVGGAVGGFVLGGPGGAVAGGIAAGAAMDGIATGVDSAVHGEYRPNGQVLSWTEAIDNRGDPQRLIKGIVGIGMTPVGDGLLGRAIGEAGGAIRQNNLREIAMDDTGRYSAFEKLDAACKMEVEGKYTSPPPAENRPFPATFDDVPVPEDGWQKPQGRVFRGDKRLLAEEGRAQLFENGIETRGVDPDAFRHTTGNTAATDFTSTSTNWRMAREFGERGKNTAVAKIFPAQRGVNINVTADLLRKTARYPGQAEVAMAGGVTPNLVEGVVTWKGNISTWHPNPNFDPPLPPAPGIAPVPTYFLNTLNDGVLIVLPVAAVSGRQQRAEEGRS